MTCNYLYVLSKIVADMKKKTAIERSVFIPIKNRFFIGFIRMGETGIPPSSKLLKNEQREA